MYIAVITGASSGLGKEYVKQVFCSRNDLDEIWIVARRQDRLNELKAELGDKIRPVALDLCGDGAEGTLAKMLKGNSAQVKLLINNAGFGKLGLFEDISTADNAAMVRLNCESLTAVTSAVLPFMPDGGEIINTCSIASFTPNTRMAVYSSTKAYVMSLSRALKVELKPRKINVLAVCPGPMETEFLPVANINKGDSKTFDSLPRVSVSGIAKRSLCASKRKKAVYTARFFYKLYRVVAKILPTALTMKFAKT